MTNHRWPIGLGVGLLLSCGGRPLERTGYLFVVGQGVEGATIDIAGWQTQSRLPFAVEEDKPVMVSGEPVEILKGKVTLFHADTRQAEILAPGWQVRSDTLLVRGETAAIGELANRLGATVAEGPDGTTALSASDIFDRVSYLEAPEDLEEVAPERIKHVTGRTIVGTSDSLPGSTSAGRFNTQGARPLPFMGALLAGNAARDITAALGLSDADFFLPMAGGRVGVGTFSSRDGNGHLVHAVELDAKGRYVFYLCSPDACRDTDPSFSGPYSVVGNELRLVPEAARNVPGVPRYFRFRIEPGHKLIDLDTKEQLSYGGTIRPFRETLTYDVHNVIARDACAADCEGADACFCP